MKADKNGMDLGDVQKLKTDVAIFLALKDKTLQFSKIPGFTVAYMSPLMHSDFIPVLGYLMI